MNEKNFIGQTNLNSALERIAEISDFVSQIENKVRTNVTSTFSNVFSELSASLSKQTFGPMVNQAAKENNLDPKLLNAVVEQESGYNPNAISRAGATGLMQLMPETAQTLGVKNPLNPVENIRAGAKYLSSLLNRYQGNVMLALSAYNAGPGNVEKFKGVPPFKETKEYVKSVMNRLA